jgi:hypothetical protein
MLNMMVNNETDLDDRHDITEILLKEALSTINHIKSIKSFMI